MRILLAVLVSAVAAVPVSAHCMFPFFPSYSAGYYGWGAPAYAAGYSPGFYSASYAPMQYGYGGGAPYSASYAGYGSSSCCPSPCAQTSCCNNLCGGGCASCTGSDCIPSEVRKEPIPDPLSRDRDLLDDRSNSGTGSGRDYESRELDPRDQFNRPGTGGSSGSNLNSDPDRWTPPGTGSRSNSAAPTYGSDRDLLNNDRSYRSDPGNEPSLFGADPEPERNGPAATEPMEFNARKPPMSIPVDESQPTESQPTEPPAVEENLGTESSPQDFLAPDMSRASQSSMMQARLTDSQLRSSHVDVLSMQRLAGRPASGFVQATQVSSSQKSARPAQWISVPLSAGRIRL